MLDTKGNTAVYLLYSYARLCSILRKSEVNETAIKGLGKPFKITHAYERNIAA
jgi:arginyl-tRNA synthetase